MLRTISVLLILTGGYLIRLSYSAFAKWTEYVNLGDPSGAEVYEVEFWLEAVPGFGLLAAGAFLLGWSVRKR